ncbi:uncharacterized protein G2W53_041301 [Senna tora]|uniref:Uncharacterized protein n=1 Tax=Senna tora TaxID=362788 RepID=A0A834VZ22_9FABA|nr:uncharacterized protein G2W53_041301 [Senna tora]
MKIQGVKSPENRKERDEILPGQEMKRRRRVEQRRRSKLKRGDARHDKTCNNLNRWFHQASAQLTCGTPAPHLMNLVRFESLILQSKS